GSQLHAVGRGGYDEFSSAVWSSDGTSLVYGLRRINTTSVVDEDIVVTRVEDAHFAATRQRIDDVAASADALHATLPTARARTWAAAAASTLHGVVADDGCWTSFGDPTVSEASADCLQRIRRTALRLHYNDRELDRASRSLQ